MTHHEGGGDPDDKRTPAQTIRVLRTAILLVLNGMGWSMITLSALHISANDLIASAAGLAVGWMGVAGVSYSIARWLRDPGMRL
ncbi:MAG: hypothetical protein KGJ23_08645 [Euryarchaeota archaeon]|nr:hypothetical protein [Euryarchaeota archaeon]MDE1836671.1 hypothetical protein [Euryarchaeota archaeon]MDE1880300.1 hypothetical protein [Euryarchaeota archaeon]MDE2044641.1 hypothetical protein [Thermoplasmata archaeon]